MVIKSSGNMNYLLRAVEEKIGTLFYGVWFDFRVFTIEQRPKGEKTVATFSIESIKEIFQSERAILVKIDPLSKVSPIHLNEAFEKMYTFSEYRGDKDKPDILQEPDSNICKDVFKFLCMLVFGSVETKNPVCFDIKAVNGTYLSPWIGWGFAIVFINENNGKGCLLYADPAF